MFHEGYTSVYDMLCCCKQTLSNAVARHMLSGPKGRRKSQARRTDADETWSKVATDFDWCVKLSDISGHFSVFSSLPNRFSSERHPKRTVSTCKYPTRTKTGSFHPFPALGLPTDRVVLPVCGAGSTRVPEPGRTRLVPG